MKSNIVAFLAVSIAFVSGPAAAIDVAGLWLTDNGSGKIEIVDCGDGTPCGSLVWIHPDEETPWVDFNNPDPALRDRSLIGLPIVWGFRRGKGKWRSGQIYDPEEGKTYRSALQLQQNGDLNVKGCIGPFCRTVIWKPAAQTEQ